METKGINFDVKEVNDTGYFEGYGSTFGGKPDSYGDVIVKGAFSDSLLTGGRNGNGVAMLYQHNADEPIGTYPVLAVNEKGLKVGGQLVLGVRRADETHLLMKAGAIKGLSIGYNVLEYSWNKGKTIRYLEKIDLWEISPVTFPANVRATITNVKSMIENAKNERELERALRESGLSISASKYIVSLMDKGKLCDEELSTPFIDALKKGGK